MSHYVGLDVSLKEVSVCVVDAEGTVLHRGSVPAEPDAIAEYISQKAPDVDRVVHESGIVATWLTRGCWQTKASDLKLESWDSLEC